MTFQEWLDQCPVEWFLLDSDYEQKSYQFIVSDDDEEFVDWLIYYSPVTIVDMTPNFVYYLIMNKEPMNTSDRLNQEELDLMIHGLDCLIDYMESIDDDKFESFQEIYSEIFDQREQLCKYELETMVNEFNTKVDFLETCFKLSWTHQTGNITLRKIRRPKEHVRVWLKQENSHSSHSNFVSPNDKLRTKKVGSPTPHHSELGLVW